MRPCAHSPSPRRTGGRSSRRFEVRLHLWLHLVLSALLLAGPAAAQAPGDLEAFWAEMSRTVAEGDLDGYAALYHPDAVLVSLGSMNSVAIAQALEGWEPGFVDTREGRAGARVDFRFTRRLHDATTAHETGMFRYVFHPAGGSPSEATVHFEALLVRMDGDWRMMMEFQKEPATEAEWRAAGGGAPDA